MYFHGCAHAIDDAILGFDGLLYGGWLEYAAANDIIMVFPQARAHFLFNPYGCFDWNNLYDETWWEKDTKYLTQDGHQMKALKNMLDRITEPRSNSYNYGARNILALNDFDFALFDIWR